MMKISDLIGLSDEMIKKSKIHFAIGATERFEPLYSFYRNDFKYWQETQNNKNSENAFWNRWKEYSINGHGGSKELKKLIESNGLDYASNFQFSILESRSMNAEDDEIIKRESFWKDILLSREYGYNKN